VLCEVERGQGVLGIIGVEAVNGVEKGLEVHVIEAAVEAEALNNRSLQGTSVRNATGTL
jgi:hypothetical protein